jgi:uncharacterized NAD(P)/FAD-binding protein YdhS
VVVVAKMGDDGDGGDFRIKGVGCVFNCTGANGESLGDSSNAVLRALHAASLVQADPLSLGIHCDDDGVVLSGEGARGVGVVEPWLYALGPCLAGRDWEAVAISDIGKQVAALVDLLHPHLAKVASKL